jgi:hypothetical protein
MKTYASDKSFTQGARMKTPTPQGLDQNLVEPAALSREGSQSRSLGRRTLSYSLIKFARLGSCLARANDPPPGIIGADYHG